MDCYEFHQKTCFRFKRNVKSDRYDSTYKSILPEVNEAVLDIIVLQQDKVDSWFTSTRTFEQHMFHMKVLVVRNTNFGIR